MDWTNINWKTYFQTDEQKKDYAEWWNKYAKMARERGISITNLGLFGLRSVNDLREKYEEDPNLNNIPLVYFDRVTEAYNAFNPQHPLSLADGCNLYKFLLVHEVLGINPAFEREIDQVITEADLD